jgi:ribonuclease J
MIEKKPKRTQAKRKPTQKRTQTDAKPKAPKGFAQSRGKVYRAKKKTQTPRRKGRKPAHTPNKQLRVIMLGGCEEVGRNCTLLEYGNDIIFVDMGLQFPEEDMPGVDYIIPNMSYIKGKEKNIRGVVITHGHLDHIGGIPHTIPNIGNPPVFALPMAAGIIKKRQQDYHTKQLNLKIIKTDSVLQLGAFKISFIHINHNIPDSAMVVIETPEGVIVHTGDWKFDYHPSGEDMPDFHALSELGRKGVLAVLGDSTNAGIPGQQMSEKIIGDELENIITKAEGRVIIGTFSSLISRVKQIIEISERLGKKVVLDGYSMKTNVEIAKQLGFIKCRQQTLIKPEQADGYADNKIVICCTGAQGEQNAALNRIANDDHRVLRIHKTDTVVFSSSIVPGNEQAVARLRDTLARKNARVLNKEILDVHAGGHAKKEDVKLMLSLTKPKYYVPIEGNHYLLKANAGVAKELGFKDENIFVPDNGQVMSFKKGSGRLTDEKVDANYVFVDGLGVGDVSQIVLRDRQVLADDGMVVVIVQIERKTGKLIGSPDIISRGFIFMKENKQMIEDVRRQVKKTVVDKDPKSAADGNYIRNQLRSEIGKFLFKKTERRPMVLPVVIEV